MSSSIMLRRREIPIAIIIFTFTILSVDYFLSGGPGMEGAIKETAKYLKDFNKCIVGAAMGVGCINLFQIHGRYIMKKDAKRWPYSTYLLALFVIGFAGGIVSKEHPIYQFIYLHIYTPANTSVYAMTGWYIASSILRTLRLRSRELVFLVFFAFLQIIIQIPMVTVYIPAIEGLGIWLRLYYTAPVMAAFAIGIALGTIAYLARMMLGQERTAYGEVLEVA